jgi:hypothetical protein
VTFLFFTAVWRVGAFLRCRQKTRFKGLGGVVWVVYGRFHGSAVLARSWGTLGAFSEVCRQLSPPPFLYRRFFSDVQRQSENP